MALPAEVWRRRAEGGPASATFIARQDGVDVGLAGVFAEPDPPGRMHLISMWVDPRHRRQGAARALIDLVVGWPPSACTGIASRRAWPSTGGCSRTSNGSWTRRTSCPTR